MNDNNQINNNICISSYVHTFSNHHHHYHCFNILSLCYVRIDAVFVGHSGAELEGAKSLGITTCSFNADLGAKGDYDIGDQFSLLLKMI